MKKAVAATVLLMLAACQPLSNAESTSEKNSAPVLSIEMFARGEKVIPLAYDHGNYHCIHIRPPAILVRNISDGNVTLTGAGIIGYSAGREVAQFSIHEDQIGDLMITGNKKINEYMSALDNQDKFKRLKRIYGMPSIMEAGYHEGHTLPPSSYAGLPLAEALYFFYEGTAVVDALEVVLEAVEASGRSSTVAMDLPYSPYTCLNDYHFPIEGACMVGSIPFGHSHRFGNSQEFAIDILDIRRFEDGSFSTSHSPSPMVIMGSDKASDYWIFGRPVRAIADGTVLEIENRFPDEFAANPREPFSQRIERLKAYLVENGTSPDSIPEGNFVFIDHGNGEYARYCHLREEILTKAGDRVKRGDVIGYVGNSGQSMEPHLHLELLDSPDFLTANGLPIVFSNLDLSRALDSPSIGEKNSFIFSEFIFVNSD